VLLAPGIAAAGAQPAAPATDAVCVNALTLTLSPGFSPRPASGTSTTGGETGTLVCTGTVGGRRISGPGTVGVQETYATGAACLSDSSHGEVTITLPAIGGPVHIAGALTGYRLGLVEVVDIAFPQARFHGTGPVLPLSGDCLLAPITRALVSITGILHS
jgi:hypothetical protein